MTAGALSRGVLLRGGRLVDPVRGHDARADVLVRDGLVAAVNPAGTTAAEGAEVVDCDGLVVSPGFVDLHVHLREPGREDAETILTGSRAAALGGYTAVCPMPNTDPPADNAGVVEMVAARGREIGLADLFPVGAVTVGRAGEQLAELGAMNRSAAAVDTFSDDGSPIREARLLRRALEYARAFDAVIADHCEDASLTAGAQMHEGELSGVLGLRGWPAAAEDMIVARDLMLAELTGGRLHLCHLSTAGSVALVRAAKARGVRVTAEAAPHHFTLTDAALGSYDPVYKVNPPLRSAADVGAVKAGLADGTIDAIATDHAPHTREDKEVELAVAPPGMLGLETALGLTVTELVETGLLTMLQAVERLTAGPARCRKVPGHGGPVVAGAPANLTVFDAHARWTVAAAGLASLARNTPYDGRELIGRVRHTMLRGAFTVRDGRLASAPDPAAVGA
jgi:dihydroorotase